MWESNLRPPPPRDDPKDNSSDDAGDIGTGMRPAINEEGGMLLARDQRCERLHEAENASLGSCESDEPRNRSYGEHGEKKFGDGEHELASVQFRTTARPSRNGQACAKRQSNPPGGDNTPKQSQNRG